MNGSLQTENKTTTRPGGYEGKGANMAVYELTRMLTNETWVIIKDSCTHKTLFMGYASSATFNDKVKDWDFSNEHIIYI